jgi:mercuric ion transport protein
MTEPQAPAPQAAAPRNRSAVRLLWIGSVGAVTAALCCLTPVLVVLLGAVGLSAFVGGLDYVLLPTLGGFAGLVVFALWRLRP